MRRALLTALLYAVSVSGFTQESPASLTQLLEMVKADSLTRAQENRAREQRFIEARDRQRELLEEVRQSLAEENARSARLKSQFDANETELTALTETLRVRIGNMGELFGVVRQVAGDTKTITDNSLVSAQIPGRGALVERLAQARGLPSIQDLTDLYVLLLEEMAESGRVVRFETDIIEADGTRARGEVVRVGVFNVISGERFLRFAPANATLYVLPRQPAGRFTGLAEGLAAAQAGIVPMAVDPSRGQLLSLLIQAPSFMERIRQGGLVGYVIIVLGALGVLIAVERLVVLAKASSGIHAQLKSDSARQDNALGRVLAAYEENKSVDNETLALKLDEAILREAPRLEKWQGSIKVLAAVAPLMGLLGTVVGMIITFQQITLFGTGDPKLMAGGISTALVTTVEGLIVAIPLVLLHSMVASRSSVLVEILEEQSAGLIARHAERSEKH